MKFTNNKTNSIDEAIETIKPVLFEVFVHKWIGHSHSKINDTKCNLTITMDGCWKIARAKCVYDKINFNSDIFGKIRTGCRKTPNINSYFCKDHHGHDLVFKINNGKKICFNPMQIKTSEMCKHIMKIFIYFDPFLLLIKLKAKDETVEEIYDSYLSKFDEEIFLVKTNIKDLKWVEKKFISKTQYENLRKKSSQIDQCNTDKENVYSCTIKCKTRGIIIGASNCGIVIGFREIYGAESLRQVGLFYLDIRQHYFSKYNFSFLNSLRCLINFSYRF